MGRRASSYGGPLLDLPNVFFCGWLPHDVLSRGLNLADVLLLTAVSRVNQSFDSNHHPPFNLLVWGGMPGEWEGEHPHTVARSLDLPNVFFCGWLPHDVLSRGLNLADVLVAPSYNEPFGQVYVEAMATGIPVIATRSGGPLDFVVETGSSANGWFCEVDDLDSLTATLHQALMNETERKRRGINALALIRGEYDWKEIAHRYTEVFGGTLVRHVAFRRLACRHTYRRC